MTARRNALVPAPPDVRIVPVQMEQRRTVSESQNLSFEQFWAWMQTHANCIVRAGTPEAVVFDDEDFHWVFGVEDENTYVVQIMRGKRIAVEIILRPSDVGFVHTEPGEHDEHIFQLVSAEAREPIYQFVFCHPFEEGGGAHTTHWN